ncbi:MAG TPA: tRNA pseudouridine synthase A, partial [Candidatus Omnitrophica bacterium]|nr:tRNA pseudouridine synthase A [Candidatus Omnitrophota bacterium]
MREYRNIKLILAYDGSVYYGWQKQKNGLTVQNVLESALRRILGEKINIISSGRTDAGVHAEYQVVNFKTKSSLSSGRIKKALNSILPGEVRVKKSEQVKLSFHARYSARSKIYRYRIFTGDFVSPFISRYVWHLP